MTADTFIINDVPVPRFFYGTAWKEDETERLTSLAIKAGFRGIDTANQRKHYFEAGVGNAVQSAIRSGTVSREELFIQTKFTFQRGQDHRLPYDPSAPIAKQVEQSFQSSLENLGVEKIDSLVLHGPTSGKGMHANDLEAWNAIERIVAEGRALLAGVSNVSAEQLATLFDKAKIKPAFVQNRCFATLGWDYNVRQFCMKNGIAYQGFSLLTANRGVWSSDVIRELASRYQRSPAEVVFRFCIDVGMIPLTGTGDPQHMSQDLAVFDWQLPAEEVGMIESLAVRQ